MKFDIGIKISKYLIYEFIRYNKEALGGKLYLCLRNKGILRRHKNDASKVKIIGRVGIEQRPLIASQKIEYGHFEGDTIVSKNHNACVITLTEKKTLQEFIIPVMKMDSESVANAIIERLRSQNVRIKTLTVDNGVEFAKHALVAQELNCSVYFAKPYCSNDKALVENHNRLIRDFVPKGSDFKLIDEKYWQEIQDILNNRPREILGFKTPNQMVAQELAICCA
jgi:IS30 family transposase